MSLRAVLFDLDGTLIESGPAIAASLNHTLASLGHPELTVAGVRARVGWGLDNLIAGLFSESEIGEAKRLYSQHYAATCVVNTTTLPGVREALVELAARGLRLGITTNKPSAFSDRIVAGLGLAPSLDLVLGADHVTRLKPDPEMLLTALVRLAVDPGQALYVGDMHIDVETGHRAGIRVVGVTSGVESREELVAAGASCVLTGVGELPARLASGPFPECLRASGTVV